MSNCRFNKICSAFCRIYQFEQNLICTRFCVKYEEKLNDGMKIFQICKFISDIFFIVG